MPSRKLSRRSFLKAASVSAACTVVGAGISRVEAAGSQAPPALPSLAPAFVAWYKFDETGGTSAADSSGSGRTATLVNGPSFVAGQAGNALNLDGTNDHVSLPAGIVSGLNDFSIATWVRLDTTGAWRRLFDFGTGTTANMFLTPQSSSNTPRFAITTSGAGDQITLTLPMVVQRVKAVSQVAADVGRVALQYGPLIYNIEAVDHNNADVRNLILSPNAALSTQWNASLLGGVVAIKGSFSNGAALTAIPNFARNNRGGRSIVWIRDQ